MAYSEAQKRATIKQEETKMKLWSVKVNNWGWDSARTLYAESKEAAAKMAAEFPAADRVKYAGNFREETAAEMLENTYCFINR